MSAFKWRHFAGEVILWAVRWYCRYGISYRELEEMLGERGVEVDHTTLYRWTQRYAPELEKRTAGQKLKPLTIHWSGCSAGCGLHQVSTIGLQGCRSRVNGEVVDAAHVCVNGKTGPEPVVATDLMYDVPCEQLADALEPLVRYLPRS